MNKKILLLSLVMLMGVSHGQQGHETHDWRTDHEAFASVQIDRRVYAQGSQFDAQGVKIEASEFKTKLEDLTRIAERGSEASRNRTREWLEQEYKALGFAVSLHNYGKGANLIAEKAGTSGKVLILSSHMDSVFNAGANDDGTGTVANLLIAKALAGSTFKHTLRILAFDNEEQGLVGSGKYVKALDAGQIIGDIQMEMMGFNSKKDGKFHLIDCDRGDAAFMTTAIMQSVQALNLPLTRVKACTDRSDHGSFWKEKIPAVVLSENFFGGDGDPCYHDKCDVIDDRIDFSYASLITQAVGSAVVKLLN